MHCKYIYQRGPKKGTPCTKKVRNEYCGEHNPNAMQRKITRAHNQYHPPPPLPTDIIVYIANNIPTHAKINVCLCEQSQTTHTNCGYTTTPIKSIYLTLRSLNKELSKRLPLQQYVESKGINQMVQKIRFNNYMKYVVPNKWWKMDDIHSTNKAMKFAKEVINSYSPTTPQEIHYLYTKYQRLLIDAASSST